MCNYITNKSQNSNKVNFFILTETPFQGNILLTYTSYFVAVNTVQQHQSQEFTNLYDTHVDAIYRFIFFKTSNQTLAWDLTQECFLKMWQYVRTEEREAIKNQKAFLYTIARNLVIDHWRQKEKSATIDLEEVAFSIPDGNDMHANTVLADDIAQMMKLLDGLPIHHREILTMRFTEELSFSEIAKIMGKSAVSVRVEAHRAIKKLKKIAEEKKNA